MTIPTTTTRARRPIGWARRAGLLLMLAIVPAIGAQEPPPPAAKPGPVTLAFELAKSNHMVVEAKVNGHGPYRLVFDSGAPISLLSNRAAEESGAIPKNAPRSFLMGLRGEGSIRSLEVGPLTARDVPVVVLDHPTVEALGAFLGRRLDGIIGYSFFSKYRTTIDYQAKVMTLEPVDFTGRDLLKEMSERMAGPKVARSRILAPVGLWGLTLGASFESGVGVVIRQVRPGSPADAAGLKVGDVLTGIDGRWTSDANDAYLAAAAAEPGREVEVVTLRDGQERKAQVRPVDGI